MSYCGVVTWLLYHNLPKVSQGAFLKEQISTPVRSTAWSCRFLLLTVACHWQKLFNVSSAWWLILKPGWKIKYTWYMLVLDSLPGEKHNMIMLLSLTNCSLPLTETIQCVISMVTDSQIRLKYKVYMVTDSQSGLKNKVYRYQHQWEAQHGHVAFSY